MTFYFQTLSLTIGIELAVVAVMRRLAPKLGNHAVLSTCVCVNLLTHPLAILAHLGIGIPFLAVEFSVVIAEAVAYQAIVRTPWQLSVSLSLSANIVSMAVGIVAF